MTDKILEKVMVLKPPLKWAGGKRQLLSQLLELMPANYEGYAEPFVGGGALFFALEPENAVLIDKNEELINFYMVLRDDVDALIEDLKKHKNTKEYYYMVRSLDPNQLSKVERASRFLFLIKTGYNGLWRVNSKGQHNVPYGKYRNVNIVDEPTLRRASQLLSTATILHGDFELIRDYAKPGMFIYFDPPYHPVSETANFTKYTADDFTEKDQIRLAQLFKDLDSMGCLLMLSNSDTPFIRELYKDYNITVVKARRAINCRADRRGPITELVIRNYEGR
jgi:DNA adenine methylase